MAKQRSSNDTLLSQQCQATNSFVPTSMPNTPDLFDATLDSAEEAELVHYLNQAPNNVPDKDNLPVKYSAMTDTVDAQEHIDSPNLTANINKSHLHELFDFRIKEKK
jgi:hypothetical protein